MIHGTYGTDVVCYLSLLESRIDLSVAVSKIRWLFKFTNDMTKAVKYSYGIINGTPNDRYVKHTFSHNTTDGVFTGRVNFKPYGYWSYEVYEVSWIASAEPAIENLIAPATETQVLEDSSAGTVQGMVHEGKLYITETAGSEQIRYTEHEPTTTNNYLYAN